VSAHHSEKLTGSITSNQTLSGVTVTFQVVTAAGAPVYSHSWTGQSFLTNTAGSYTADWKVPVSATSGIDTLQITVTSSSGSLLASDLSAGQFIVR